MWTDESKMDGVQWSASGNLNDGVNDCGSYVIGGDVIMEPCDRPYAFICQHGYYILRFTY